MLFTRKNKEKSTPSADGEIGGEEYFAKLESIFTKLRQLADLWGNPDLVKQRYAGIEFTQKSDYEGLEASSVQIRKMLEDYNISRRYRRVSGLRTAVQELEDAVDKLMTLAPAPGHVAAYQAAVRSAEHINIVRARLKIVRDIIWNVQGS